MAQTIKRARSSELRRPSWSWTVLTVLGATAFAGSVMLPPVSHGQTATPKAPETAKPGNAPKPGAKLPSDKSPGDKSTKKSGPREGSMTIARMDTIIRRLDRMRILSPVSKAADIPADLLKRLMQANFDTALDARYAIARDVVWATYIHPLSTLHDRQFISAIGQTVNLALTFGTTFSSGAMNFGGGDSRDIIRKQLIEKLLKKGLPI